VCGTPTREKIATVHRAVVSSLGAALLVGISTDVSAGPDGQRLPYEPAVELPLTAAGIVGYLLSDTIFKDDLAPEGCRWCASNGFDRGIRDALLWDEPSDAETVSDLGFVAVPLATLGVMAIESHDDRGVLVDAAIIIEAVTIATDLDQLVKMTVGRERPFVHALPPEDKPLTEHPADNDLSFYSGHTTWTFAFATAAGTIASRRGYDSAPYIWVGGLGLAATTGYLRIAADKHWGTDVLAGAALGAAIGYLVPRYLHARRTVEVAPLPDGVAITGSF